MTADDVKMRAFAQSVMLAMTGKYMDQDDLDGDDGAQWLIELVDWTNQLLDELELESDWNYVTELGKTIGTIATPTDSFSLPTGVRKLSVRENRPLKVLHDGIAVSLWDVVKPSMITATRTGYPLRERVTYVNRKIVFSRSLNTNEVTGTIVADVINDIPRLVYVANATSGNVLTVLDLIEPRQLLVLGVAKNATLPDFVRGNISPSLAQKYNDLLSKAIAENEATASFDEVEREDLGYIRGVY